MGIVGIVKEFRIVGNLNDYVELHSFLKCFCFDRVLKDFYHLKNKGQFVCFENLEGQICNF